MGFDQKREYGKKLYDAFLKVNQKLAIKVSWHRFLVF